MATHSSICAWRIPWTEEPQAAVHGVTNSRTRLSDFTYFGELNPTSHTAWPKKKKNQPKNKDLRDFNRSMAQKKRLWFKSSGKCGWLECRPGARREAQERPARP